MQRPATPAQSTSPRQRDRTETGNDIAGANLHSKRSPPATTTQTTGEASRDPMVKKMNEDEKQKVDTKGK